VFLDATNVKARVTRQIVVQAIFVAVGIAAGAPGKVLGFVVGDTENQGFWTAFLRSFNTRGLDRAKLVMSGARLGLKKAINTIFQHASWQSYRACFVLYVLSLIPKESQDAVVSIIRTVFAQLDRTHVLAQFKEVTTMLARSHPKVTDMLDEARHDFLTFASLPEGKGVRFVPRTSWNE
jgi:putative transposase